MLKTITVVTFVISIGFLITNYSYTYPKPLNSSIEDPNLKIIKKFGPYSNMSNERKNHSAKIQ